MAVKLEQTKVVHPDTARAITLFVDQNGYDCDKVICSTQLQARNRAVRDHLKTLIAEKTPSNEIVHIKEQDPLVIDGSVITTATNGNADANCGLFWLMSFSSTPSPGRSCALA